MKPLLIITFLLIGNSAWAALPAFDAHFKDSKFGKVEKREMGPFVVSWVHPRDELIVEALLKHLMLADKDLAPVFKDKSGERKKIPVEVFPDLKTFSEVSGLSLARFKATGTIALTLEQRLMILSPRTLAGGYPWAVTVVHEYVHYLIREISPENIPIWLHEGVAQFYQGYPYIKDWNLEPSQWGVFKKAKEKKKWLNLETLKEPFPYRKDPEEAELAYIEALLFIKWLDQKCGAVNLVRYAGELKSIESALSKCTKMTAAELDKKFISEILSGVKIPDRSDVQFFARDFSGGDPLDSETRKMDKKSKNFAVLANEAYRQGRYRATVLEMEKAFSATPVHPPSWSRQLAQAFEKTNRMNESRQTLENLIRDYPTDAAAWYLLGLQRLKTETHASSWEAFLKSFFINPFLEGLEEQMVTLRQRNPQFSYSFLDKTGEK